MYRGEKKGRGERRGVEEEVWKKGKIRRGVEEKVEKKEEIRRSDVYECLEMKDQFSTLLCLCV